MPRVTLDGDLDGEYVVTEQRSDGALVLKPDLSAAAMHRRLGSRPATEAEVAEFMHEHGARMLPPDGEG